MASLYLEREYGLVTVSLGHVFFEAVDHRSVRHNVSVRNGPAKSLRRRLIVKRHTLPEVPFSRPFPLIRLLLEVGIFFITTTGNHACGVAPTQPAGSP